MTLGWIKIPTLLAFYALALNAALPLAADPLVPLAKSPDAIRLATYNVALERKGPGVLLRDIAAGKDKIIRAVQGLIDHADADVILLTAMDQDFDGLALAQLNAGLAAPYPHRFTRLGNAGRATPHDLDQDGRLNEREDSVGYGGFAGSGGMGLLSRYPLAMIADLSDVLWRDLPGADLPVNADGTPYYSDTILADLPVSSVGHWVVSAQTPSGPLALMSYYAASPAFDGPEDRNGNRAGDETALWLAYLDGLLADFAPPDMPVVIMGDANLDPMGGQGPRARIQALLDHPRLQDPKAASDAAAIDGVAEGARLNRAPAANAAQHTADWPDDRPGNLRVDYVLPDRALTVVDAGVLWPAPESPLGDLVPDKGSAHRLVFVDVTR